MGNEGSSRWWPFLAGIAAGAALGVLFAPRSGKETRDAMRNAGGALKDDMDEAIGRMRAEWAQAKGKAQDAASMSKEEVDDLLRFIMEEGRDLYDRVKNGPRPHTENP
jgi:gas vesicle protein